MYISPGSCTNLTFNLTNVNLKTILFCMTPHATEVINLLVYGIYDEEWEITTVYVLLEALHQIISVNILHCLIVHILPLTVEIVIQGKCPWWFSPILDFFLFQELSQVRFA